MCRPTSRKTGIIVWHLPNLRGTDGTSLQPSNTVKLIFRIRTVDASGEEEINTERIWVTTESVEGVYYQGKLDNNPLCPPTCARDSL